MRPCEIACFKHSQATFQTGIKDEAKHLVTSPSTLFFFPTCSLLEFERSFWSISFFTFFSWCARADDAFYTQLAKHISAEQHHGRPGRKPACRQRIRASIAITFGDSWYLPFTQYSWFLLVWMNYRGSCTTAQARQAANWPNSPAL